MRIAQETEYKKLIKFGNRIFRKKFPKLLPKLYKDRPQYAKNHIVEDAEGGNYKGMMALIKIPLMLGAGVPTLNCYGIGTVSVNKKCRKQGIMSKMLNYAIQNAEDADIMFLSGKRQRYQNFGFVPAGQIAKFTFFPHNFKKTNTDITFKKLDKNSPYLTKLWEDYNGAKQGFLREEERFYDILRSWRCHTYVIMLNNQPIGCICGRLFGNIVEEIYTNYDINEVISAFIAKGKKMMLSVKISAYQQKELAALYRTAESYSLSVSANTRICNFCNVIERLLNYKATYQKLLDGVLNIGIEGTNYRVEVQNNLAQVRVENAVSDVVMDRVLATQVLLTNTAMLLDAPALFTQWFPLPFSVTDQDNV